MNTRRQRSLGVFLEAEVAYCINVHSVVYKTNMDIKMIMLSEVSQTEKNRYHDTNELIYGIKTGSQTLKTNA